MKKTNLRKSRGITLIALVITIIVLLILAGVAISMLSGENGILGKAAEAKTRTEEGQKQEETALTSMELEMHFQTKNKKYKCSNGFITGIEIKDTVEDLESALPEGYTADVKYNFNKEIDETITDKKIHATTGVGIVRNNEIVARVVVYGDVDSSGGADLDDSLYLRAYLTGSTKKMPDFAKVAMDVNHDNYISQGDFEYNVDNKIQQIKSDAQMITDAQTGGEKINQQYYAQNPNDIELVDKKFICKDFFNNLPEKFKQSKYSITIDEGSGKYKLNGVTSETTAQELIDLLPDETTIQMITDEPPYFMDVTGSDPLASGEYNIVISAQKWWNNNSTIEFASFKVE